MRPLDPPPSPFPSQAHGEDPLLLRALRGESVSRPPVWLMRQAGRYMKVYQDLCKQHTTFRERSENADLAVEISLQPWRAFQPDGVILFSDILTPISGMGIPFDITAGKGPIIPDPIRTQQVGRPWHNGGEGGLLYLVVLCDLGRGPAACIPFGITRQSCLP